MNAVTWPTIRKSAAMEVIERRHAVDGESPDIRDVLLDALASHNTDKEAAASLDIDNTTLSTWIVKLRIDERAAAIRSERGDVY